MASSSGNSSTQIQNSGSEEDLQVVMDQRKRKRMQSNRESARRSRMRKQQHLDELMAKVNQFGKENGRILSNINITNQLYLKIEAENLVLRAQMAELRQRLQSLEEIVNVINSGSNGGFEMESGNGNGGDGFMNPFGFVCVNQPIMAAADIFHY